MVAFETTVRAILTFLKFSTPLMLIILSVSHSPYLATQVFSPEWSCNKAKRRTRREEGSHVGGRLEK